MLTKKNFIYIKISLPKINWLRVTVPITVINLIINDFIDLIELLDWLIRLEKLELLVDGLYKALETIKEFRKSEESEIFDMDLGKENISISVKLK